MEHIRHYAEINGAQISKCVLGDFSLPVRFDLREAIKIENPLAYNTLDNSHFVSEYKGRRARRVRTSPSQQNQQGESNPQRKIVCIRGDGWQNLKGDYTADWPQDDSIQICKDYIPLMVFQVRKAMKENECPLSPEIAQIAVGLSLPRLDGAVEPLR
ncbi:hypothetical protein CDAR_590221 [Caerostris darwini]|uniref:Uncharacterized protein n=1 Tax=Caerostris darwini TaxID=1538125 RepID=A0AAV4NNG8_9ARAC|nr:hypothetical protein CDAR_590221 [Caerostris darwini]